MKKKEIQGKSFYTLIGWLFADGFVMISSNGEVITRDIWDAGVMQYVDDSELRGCIFDRYSTAIELNGFTFPEEFYMYHGGTYRTNGFWYTFYFKHLVPAEWCKNIVRNWPDDLYEYEKFRGNLGGKRPNRKMVELDRLIDLNQF